MTARLKKKNVEKAASQNDTGTPAASPPAQDAEVKAAPQVQQQTAQPAEQEAPETLGEALKMVKAAERMPTRNAQELHAHQVALRFAQSHMFRLQQLPEMNDMTAEMGRAQIVQARNTEQSRIDLLIKNDPGLAAYVAALKAKIPAK